MRGVLLVVATLFICVITASDVLDLNTESFDSHIKDNEFILVEFYAPWCGHCKHLAPEYEVAATQVKGDGIILAKVDGTQEPELMTRFSVRGFPTLFFFKNGTQIPYTGPRDADGIAQWVRKKSGPTTTLLSSAEEISTFSSANPVAIIGHFTKDSANEKVFMEAADQPQLEGFSFGLVNDEAVTKGADAKENTIQLVRSFDDTIVYDEDFTSAQLSDWISQNGYPYLMHAQESWSRLRSTGKPITLVILDEQAEDAQATRDLLISLAKQNKDTFGFAYVGKELLANVREMGVSGEKVPTLVVANALGHNYPYPDENEFNSENINTWLKSIVEGNVKRHFKSEPIPESNEGPVTVIVGNSFQELVLDSDKDVFVEFYATWCGHCQQLAPIYEQLAEHYKEDSHVTIAKIDGTLNDNPSVVIEGFPTIYLFPANDKQNPIEYEGSRDLQGMIQFITEHRGTQEHDHSEL